MRRKSDGTAFEKEFRKAMEERFYIKRLPTLTSGYAGQSQPSDFIVIGNHFNYAEVKETMSDRFSISQMQQYEEFKTFVEERKRLGTELTGIREMDYVLVVHFLKYGVYKIVNSLEMIYLLEKKSTLKYNQDIGQTFNDLETFVKEIHL